jgi:hypothetical protein
MIGPEWALNRARLNMSREDYLAHRRNHVVHLVAQAQKTEISLLLAAREINRALHELPELAKQVQEADFLFLTGVSSECDDVPLGVERKHWAVDSLREKDLLAQNYEGRVREKLLMALSRIASDLPKRTAGEGVNRR